MSESLSQRQLYLLELKTYINNEITRLKTENEELRFQVEQLKAEKRNQMNQEVLNYEEYRQKKGRH